MQKAMRHKQHEARRLAFALLCLVAGSLQRAAGQCTDASYQNKTKPTAQSLKLTYIVPSLPLLVAESKGLFEKTGVWVQACFVPQSIALFKQLYAGDLDVFTGSLDNIVQRYVAPNPDNPAENATKLQVLAGTVLGNNLGLVARADKVVSITDLGGKPIIVDNPNSGFALAARRILADYNLTLAGPCKSGVPVPSNKYCFVPLGGTPLRYAALFSTDGNYTGPDNATYTAYATMLPDFYYTRAAFEFPTLARQLARITDIYKPLQNNGIAVAKSRLANATFTDQVTRLIAGLILGDRFARKADNRQEVLSIIRGEICEGESPAWCDAAAAEYYTQVLSKDQGESKDEQLDVKGFANIIRVRQDVLKNATDANNVYNTLDAEKLASPDPNGLYYPGVWAKALNLADTLKG